MMNDETKVCPEPGSGGMTKFVCFMNSILR